MRWRGTASWGSRRRSATPSYLIRSGLLPLHCLPTQLRGSTPHTRVARRAISTTSSRASAMGWCRSSGLVFAVRKASGDMDRAYNRPAARTWLHFAVCEVRRRGLILLVLGPQHALMCLSLHILFRFSDYTGRRRHRRGRNPLKHAAPFFSGLEYRRGFCVRADLFYAPPCTADEAEAFFGTVMVLVLDFCSVKALVWRERRPRAPTLSGDVDAQATGG